MEIRCFTNSSTSPTPGIAAPETHGVEPSRCSRDLENIHRAAIFFRKKMGFIGNSWDFHGISMGFHGYVQDFMGFNGIKLEQKSHLESFGIVFNG
jgi:hypothetical protein